MLIDWFTVCAQAVNFLLLVWLLKRFLYQPVLQAIASREKRVADQLQQAADRMTEAQQERDNFKRQNEELERRRMELLAQATAAAQSERQKLFADARKDSEVYRLKYQAAAREEYEKLNRHLAGRVQKEVLDITRKVLADLSATNLEDAAVLMFLRRLQDPGSPVREKLSQALKTAAEPACLRSVFPLPLAQQAAIKDALGKLASTDIAVRFETSSSLLCGLELVVGGQKFAWNMDEYIHSFEESVGQLLSPKTEAQLLTPLETK